MLGFDVAITHPNFGQLVPCTAPGCLKEQFQAYRRGEPYLAKRGIQPRQTFETFKAILGTEKALAASKSLAEGDADSCWLLIYGGVGNGKTHLANAVAHRLNERGIDCRLSTIPDLTASLRQAIKQDNLEEQIEELKNLLALVLDDFGMEYGTDWERARIEELLDSRYRNYRITMMTTNLDLVNLPERILSRFSDTKRSRRVLNRGGDYRR